MNKFSSSNKEFSAGPGRLFFTMGLWIYGILTAKEIFPIALTFPTFLVIAYQLSKIRGYLFGAADMLWLCFMIFFVVVPCQVISSYAFIDGAVGGLTYTLEEFVLAELIILLFFLAFILGGRFVRQKSRSTIISGSEFFYFIALSGWRILLLIALIVFGFLSCIYFSGGVNNLLLPRLEKNSDDVSFISFAFLSLVVVSVLLVAKVIDRGRSVAKYEFSKLLKLILIFGAGMLLVLVNPFNSARFFLVGTWLPIVLAYLGDRAKYYYVYSIILFGLFVVMPVLSVVSRFGLSAFGDLADSSYVKDVYIIKDVDIFDTLVHAVRFMDSADYFLGENIVAIFLFFVPRSFWVGKPIVGGLQVGNDLYSKAYAGTNNLSFFIAGDFYMDFGWIGILVCAAIMGYFWNKFYSSNAKFGVHHNLKELIVIGSLPILIRGPVGAVIGFFVCMMVFSKLYEFIFAERKYSVK